MWMSALEKGQVFYICATGPFSRLPFHAAGIFEGNDFNCVDKIASPSYTPNLSMLMPLPMLEIDEIKVLAIGQSDTPYAPLPGTVDELRRIKKHSKLNVKCLERSSATVDGVVSAMKDVHVVHFACHGEQNLFSPLDSALILHNGRLQLSRLMGESFPKAGLAYLSACQTAQGSSTTSKGPVVSLIWC
jgi:CHAT domain-containing protein